MLEHNSIVGRLPYSQFMAITLAVIAAIITIKAVSIMMFASLGSTPSSRLSYVLVLQTVLAVIGISSYLSNSVRSNSLLKQLSFFLTTALCGLLLGFYYAGSYTDNNPRYAIFGAIACGIIFTIIAVFQKQLVVRAISFISSICAYGFALMAGIRGINLLAAAQFTPGIIWIGISLIFIGLSVANVGTAQVSRSSLI